MRSSALVLQFSHLFIFFIIVYIFYLILHSNDAFHRMLYVFVCQSGSCVKTTVLSQDALLQAGAALRKPSVAVYRSQLPENNKFYELDIKNDDSNEVFYRKPGGTKCVPLLAHYLLL